MNAEESTAMAKATRLGLQTLRDAGVDVTAALGFKVTTTPEKLVDMDAFHTDVAHRVQQCITPASDLMKVCMNPGCEKTGKLMQCSKCRIVVYCRYCTCLACLLFGPLTTLIAHCHTDTLSSLLLSYRDSSVCQKEHWKASHKLECNANFIMTYYCGKGKLDKVTEFLRQHRGSLKESDFFNALRHACRKGHLAVVKHLVDEEKCGDLAVRGTPTPTGLALIVSDTNETVLYATCECGHRDILAFLVSRGGSIHVRLSNGSTALMAAAEWGHADVVDLLIELGIDCNLCNDEGLGALEVAVNNSNATEDTKLVMTRMLVERGGVRVNDRNNMGQNALSAVCHYGFLSIAQYLFGHPSVDINLKDKLGGSYITVACINGHAEIVHLLLSLGGEADATDVTGNRPLLRACEYGHAKVVELLLRPIPLLKQPTRLSSKADINYRHRSYGNAAIHVAVSQNFPELVDLLLREGADPNLAAGPGSILGATPLYLAAQAGRLAVVKALLAAGAVAGAKFRGRSAAQAAAFKGHSDIAALLALASSSSPSVV